MKRNFLLIFFIFFVLNSFPVIAQKSNDSILYKNPPKWSFKLGANFGGYQGIESQITYFIKKRYSIGINILEVFRNSKNTPSDYYFTSIFSKETSHNVGEKLTSFGLSTGYLIQIPKTRTRLHLQAGIYYNTLKYPDNFKRTGGGSDFFNIVSTNYSYSMYKKTYFSFVVSPAYEFPVFNHFGMSLQPMLLISPEDINMMINFSINIGNATSKPIRKQKK